MMSKPSPRRAILWTLLTLALILPYPFCEVLYHRAAMESFESSLDELRRSHPHWLRDIAHEFTRFGHGSGFTPAVTLRHDLQAWTALKLGLPSELDHPLEQHGIASYNAFIVEAYHDEPVKRREAHTFEWNPWRCAFVVTRSRCTEPACPWAAR